MSIVIAPVEVDSNDVDNFAQLLGGQLMCHVTEKIISLCVKHQFPILHIVNRSGVDFEQRKSITLEKIHNLIEIIHLMKPDYETAIMLSGLFEYVIRKIQTYNHDWGEICMLSVEGVELFNQIARCENAQELRSFIEHHPIFPVGKE